MIMTQPSSICPQTPLLSQSPSPSTMSSPPRTMLNIVPFPGPLVPSLNLNVVGFHPASWNTKTQGPLTPKVIRKEHKWKRMVFVTIGSRPVQSVYLPVMATVQGVSCFISHGQWHQSASSITCTIAWLIPRITVLGWVTTRIMVLGFVVP